MAKAIMVSIRPEQIEQICGAGAQVEVRNAYTLNRGPARTLYLYCAEGADRQVWIGPEHAYVDDHAHAETDVCGSGKVIGECLCRDVLPFGPCVDSIISPDDFCSYGERRESDEQAP